MKVRFCNIDARDDSYCGYNTVAFTTERGVLRLGPINGRLAMLMQAEYLTELYKLQRRIADKYELMFTNKEKPVTDSNCFANGIYDKKDYDAAELEAKQLFPGPQAEYYT
jgi:hypothetical protein